MRTIRRLRAPILKSHNSLSQHLKDIETGTAKQEKTQNGTISLPGEAWLTLLKNISGKARRSTLKAISGPDPGMIRQASGKTGPRLWLTPYSFSAARATILEVSHPLLTSSKAGILHSLHTSRHRPRSRQDLLRAIRHRHNLRLHNLRLHHRAHLIIRKLMTFRSSGFTRPSYF